MAVNSTAAIDDGEAISAKAQAAVSKGDWAAAAEAYELLVQKDPLQPEWKYQLAEAYEQQGRFEDSIALLTDPSMAGRDKTTRRLAKTYIEAKQFELAMPLVDELIAMFPTAAKYAKWKSICEISSRIQRGQDLVAGDRLEEAERLYVDLLSEYPEAARAYLHLGQIYSQQGRWAEAIPPLRSGLRVDPENLKLKTGLARALFKNGEIAEAIALLKGDHACAKDAECLFLLQRCHTELHEWERVDEVAAQLLSMLGPDDPLRETVSKGRLDALVERDSEAADALARSGDFDAAISGYRKVVEQHPQAPLAWLKLGSALADAGRGEGAVVAYREAINRHPDDPDIRAAMSREVLRSPDEQEILRYAQEAVASGNADFECLRWLARYHCERDEWTETLENASRAVALDPESSSARILLVRALVQLDRYPEALDQLETLLAAGEKRVEALQLKGDVLVRLSRLDEAIAAYCQGLRLSRRDPLLGERLESALQLKTEAETFPLRTLDELPFAVDATRIDDVMRPFLGSEVDDQSWNKRHRKMWRRAVDRAATGRESRRDRELVEQEYAVWATMGFDRYRTDRDELQGAPWSWRGRRLFLDGAAAARLRAVMFAGVLRELKPRRVLEVGSGNGMNLLTLAGAFPEIEFVGLELTSEGVEESRKGQRDPATQNIIKEYAPFELTDESAIERISFIQGDAGALPFEDESFDLVLTVLAIEQMESIRSAALSEIARVNSGHVLMLEPFRDENRGGLKGLYAHSRGYFRGSICELRDFGLGPLWATADFPQETFLGTALVLSEKRAGPKLS
jgi:tetratricopeptide (TPR) repeat protein/SAM-dependent methyltransferase